MRSKFKHEDRNNYKKGFSLVEIIVVIAIIAILALIAVSSFRTCVRVAKNEACIINCIKLEKMYREYLIIKDSEHTDAMFAQYLQEYGEIICPDQGSIIYWNNKVQCTVHPRDNNEDESVPFL